MNYFDKFILPALWGFLPCPPWSPCFSTPNHRSGGGWESEDASNYYFSWTFSLYNYAYAVLLLQLCTYQVFISYMPRINPSFLESAGLLCIRLLPGFLPSLKKPGRVRTLHCYKHDFTASPLRVSSWRLCFCTFLSVERWTHIQMDPMLSYRKQCCNTQNVIYSILKMSGEFSGSFARIFYIFCRRGKNKNSLQYRWTIVISFGQSEAVIPKNIQVLKNKMQWKLQPNTALVAVLCCCLN